MADATLPTNLIAQFHSMESHVFRLLILFLLPLLCVPWANSETMLSQSALAEDISVLRRTLETLHPGLQRYNDDDSLEHAWTELGTALESDRTLADTYLAISKMLAKLGCGHTYANYLNQPYSVANELFDHSNKFPLAFDLVDGRMIVTRNGTDDDRIVRGAEVVAIGGIATSQIITSLLPYVRADGRSEAMRRYGLQVTGMDEYETFDVFFPLVYPPQDGAYVIDVALPGSRDSFTTSVRATSVDGRRAAFRANGDLDDDLDSMWTFRVLDESTAYLRMASFVTWNFDFKWVPFLRDVVNELEAKAIPNLIIDVRGNGGGDDAVYRYLLGFMSSESIDPAATRSVVAYQRVPDDLRPYLETWDKGFFEREDLTPTKDGMYTLEASRAWRPGRKQYNGKVYLLVDGANSSATLILAYVAKRDGLATLAGEQTGGSTRGINGGQLFFLRLPNSKIEVDIPLIAFHFTDSGPGFGVMPDVVAPRTAESIAANRDVALRRAVELIEEDGP